MTSTIKPLRIRVEASSHCQLRCPACPTTMKAIDPVVGKGFLRFNDFKQLIDDAPWLKEIELSNYGEILLNPDILSIMEYAQQASVRLTANNGVNLNNAKEEVLEGLVKYRFLSMTCSIDGASNESYPIYRVRGHFDTVIENIKTINRFKRQYRSPFPQLTWQFVVFGHNEHEIADARDMAKELNMRFRPKLSWDSEFSPIKDKEKVKRQIGLKAATREEFKRLYGHDYADAACHQLWDNPQVNWDGKVLGCCVNYWGEFGGNVFEDGLVASLNSEKISYAREMLIGKAPDRSDIPCSTCAVYRGMLPEQKWLKRRIQYTMPKRIYHSLGIRYLGERLKTLLFGSSG